LQISSHYRDEIHQLGLFVWNQFAGGMRSRRCM
jgi:hypothetical protein